MRVSRLNSVRQLRPRRQLAVAACERGRSLARTLRLSDAGQSAQQLCNSSLESNGQPIASGSASEAHRWGAIVSRGYMSTRKKKLRGATDYHAKCDAPVEEFVSFAKGLQRGKRSLEALAASPAADRFANRLVAEALSGEAHAPACLSLIGHFVTDEFWLGKLRSNDPTGDAPSPNELRPKDVEAVSRALLVVLPEAAALAWIAFAYLSMKGASALRTAVQNLLLETSSPNALLEAFSRAVAAIETNAKPVPRSVVSRTIAAVEKFAEKQAGGGKEAASALAGLATSATRAELTRLLSAILSLQQADASDSANAEAAWTLADEALARALQSLAALTHALNLATDVDSRVKGYAEIVAQAVESVAAKRELELQGAVGETTEYNPAVHQDDTGIKPHSLIRIRRPAVAQGKDNLWRIIKKAEIGPA